MICWADDPYYVVCFPNGFSAEIDHFRPWLMGAGSPLAHVMVPGH